MPVKPMFRRRISLSIMRKLLAYDPITGHLRWKIDMAPHVRAGSIAGTPVNEYVRIGIRGVYLYAHVVAWVLMTGKWPKKEIDHKNTMKADNRWENLRLATHSQNRMNTKLYRGNSSGYKGVSWHKTKSKFQSYIRKDNVQYYLGYFDCPKEASAAYQIKAQELFGEYKRFQ